MDTRNWQLNDKIALTYVTSTPSRGDRDVHSLPKITMQGKAQNNAPKLAIVVYRASYQGSSGKMRVLQDVT